MSTAVQDTNTDGRFGSIARAGVGVTLAEFYGAVLPASGLYTLFSVPRRKHVWVDRFDLLVCATERVADEADWYFAVGAFSKRERKQEFCEAKRCFYLDIDAGDKKYARDPEGAYRTFEDARDAAYAFIRATKLTPTFIISSGEGLHLYYALDADVPPAHWNPVAKALGAFAARQGLKVDRSCTTDSARVLRPIGALHNNGKRVTSLFKKVGPIWNLAALSERVAILPAPEPALLAPTRAKRKVNDAVLMWEPTPTSAFKVAEKCAALREVAAAKGDVQEPLWRAMLGVVKFSVEGLDAAHEWSRGHDSYDPAETEEKFNRYAGTGPTTCETFGRLTKACEGCEHRGKITSPMQLGRMTGQEVAALPEEKRPPAPPEFAALNARYAQVRMGTDVVIADTQTPNATVDGVHRGLGFLTTAALRQTLAGQTIMVGDKLRPLADAWMVWSQRSQYEGVVFAPGEEVPPSMLNLYQGFGVVSAAGDVSLWLRLLEALIPDERQRNRVLKGFAWKVQNPGGVPGVILILSGGKGTGKNSLVDPIVRIFGAHGAVYDDSEQVAGRFTGHLMTIAFAVLDEALFTGDPRQMDRIKARVTATNATYEFKGRDPIRGVNRCAYVSLTNHTHVWQATIDERRAFVVTVADTLRGDRAFWRAYHLWLSDGGSAALLHYLMAVDLSGFDPRQIPQSDALAQQVEMTALRSPAAAWWHAVLCEGSIFWREDGGIGRRVTLNDDAPTTLDKEALRLSFTAGDNRRRAEWAGAMRQLRAWVGDAGLREVREREGTSRTRVLQLPSLSDMRAGFTAATGASGFDEPS